MSSPPLAVRACVFDAYGTLFDFASAAAACPDLQGEQASLVTQLWRDKQIAYSWWRGLQGRHADFWQVTEDALLFALKRQGLTDPALPARLMDLYRSLRCFDDVAGCLQRLRGAGLVLAILSNGTPSMLRQLVEINDLDALFTALLSVESVGVFKPHPSVYQLAVDRLGVPAGEICFLSSNGWDAYAASAFGMKVVWCNRGHQPPENLPGQPDFVIDSLTALPGLVL